MGFGRIYSPSSGGTLHVYNKFDVILTVHRR